MSARRIVVTSGKGVVGKTTTTANLGAALALRAKIESLADALLAGALVRVAASVRAS